MKHAAAWTGLMHFSTTVTALAMCAQVCVAAPLADDSIEERFRQMQQEIEQLREENQSMRGEIDQLRAATQDDWLTERRAEEIRGIVYDVLADADTRASLLGDGLMAGWRDGFFLASADGRFKLGLGGQVQTRYVFNFRDQADRRRSGFEITRARLALSGHLYTPDLQYMVRGDFRRFRRTPAGDTQDRGSFHLLDAWARYHFNNEWSMRFGQFKLPFSREFLVSSAHQLLTERSVVDSNLNLGRSIGVELTWATDESRFTAAYSDGATDNIGGFTGVNIGGGAPGGQPTNITALTEAVEYAWTLRYEHLLAGTWAQFSDFTSPMGEEFGVLLGIAGHIQRDDAGQPRGPFTPPINHTKWYGYTIDASVEFGGANLFSSFTHHYIEANAPRDNFNFFGVVAHAGVYITPKVEVFGRYEFGHWSTELIDPDDLHLITAGVNYYLEGHDVKWTTDVGVGLSVIEQAWAPAAGDITGWRSEGPDAKPQIVFRTQFQLLF